MTIAPFDSAPSLREIVMTRAMVGRRVRVTGRCLPPSRVFGLSQSPRIRSAWQLQSDGVTVFVVGPLPRACVSAATATTSTIIALVAEDTLPAIGDLPPAPRRYLVRVDADKQ